MNDEREEGEIVDDDDRDIFEAVSEGSMGSDIPSPPPPPRLSDDPEDLCTVALSNSITQTKTHRKRRRKRKSDPKITYRPNKHVPNSDSDEEWVDRSFARKLHKALKHESPAHILQNSLRTRLKLMPLKCEDNNQNAQAADNSIVVIESESGENEVEEIKDTELVELRLAALKTVVLTNHDRRKRKAKTSNTGSEKENTAGSNNDAGKGESELDKENDLGVINEAKKARKDSGLQEGPEGTVNGNVVQCFNLTILQFSSVSSTAEAL